MSTVGEFREIHVQPGRRAEYLRMLQPLCRQVQIEPGTLIYLLHTDRDQPDTVWLYARFRDRAAQEAHHSSRVFERVSSQAQPLEQAVNDLKVELIGNKGVPLDPRGLRSFAG
jgi:quinol monooxygenase YgiN